MRRLQADILNTFPAIGLDLGWNSILAADGARHVTAPVAYRYHHHHHHHCCHHHCCHHHCYRHHHPHHHHPVHQAFTCAGLLSAV